MVLEQWHPGAGIALRNVMVKPLPEDGMLAWFEARKDLPDLTP